MWLKSIPWRYVRGMHFCRICDDNMIQSNEDMFKQLWKEHDRLLNGDKSDVVMRGSKIDLIMRESEVILFSTRDNIMLYSFFLNQGFVPLGFPGKVFNEATLIIIVYSFSFTEFLSQWVFLSKVLMRHDNICYGHPRGSVMNIDILLYEWMSM